MTITVKLGSVLRAKAPPSFEEGEGRVTLDAGSRVSDLLAALNIAPGNVNLIYRNHHLVGPSAHLADGDRVGLFPPNFIHFSQFYLKREE